MKPSKLPMPLRRGLAWGYLVLALLALVPVIILPGEAPLSVNDALIKIESEQFVDYHKALGEGADNYEINVVDDLPGIVASAAADYPDGSNVLLAAFDAAESATAARERLAGMIPHRTDKHDLWALHFVSDSGEYVMLAVVSRYLVMVIAEGEAQARQRLAALPVLHYNSDPGLGAVLAQQPPLVNFLLLGGYTVVQWLLIRMLFVWAGIRSAPQGQADI